MSIDPNEENFRIALLEWLQEQKLIKFKFDKVLNEQMVEITNMGVIVNDLLNQLKGTSEVAKATNEFAAEKYAEIEKEYDQKQDRD